MNSQPSARVVSDREFVLEHTFRAPAAKVWAGYTDPELIPRWWVSRGGSMRIETLDIRPGGTWRFRQKQANGDEMIFHGRYLEVKPVTRLVYTYAIEGQADKEIRATIELSERNGQTHLTLTNLCTSKEARDEMLRYGAAIGAKMAWDALERALAEA